MRASDLPPTCEVTLYFSNGKAIEEMCTVQIEPYLYPIAISLRPRVWVVSVASETTVYKVCLHEQDKSQVKPPYGVVTLEQSCLAYVGESLFLPASTEMSLEVENEMMFPLGTTTFTAKYQPITKI